MKLLTATFICENLFGRYAFLEKPPMDQPKDYAELIKLTDDVPFEPGRNNALKPKEIIEAERKKHGRRAPSGNAAHSGWLRNQNLIARGLFNAQYMGNCFDRIVLMDGNNPRGIDVGLLICKGLKVDVTSIRTHADDAAAEGFLPTTNLLDMAERVRKARFWRDRTGVDLMVAGQARTYAINHLKASVTKADGSDPTTAKRRGQAERVALMAWRARAAGRIPIVMGDLDKDIAEPGYDGTLDPLAKSTVLANPFKAAPAAER